MNNLTTSFRTAGGAYDPARLLQHLALGRRLDWLARPSAALPTGRGEVDSAVISTAARSAAAADRAERLLGKTRGLIAELRALVGDRRSGADASPLIDEDRQRIDAMLETVNRVAEASRSGDHGPWLDASLYATSGVELGINNLNIDFADLLQQPNAFMTVELDVLASAQTAEVYLSTGACLIPPNTGSITLRIETEHGSQQLSFVSGTAQSYIVSSINAFTSVLGVSAIQSDVDENRLELRTTEYGDDRFLFVETLDANGDAATLLATSASAAVDSSRIKDVGQDVELLINGQPAAADGLDVQFQGEDLALSFTIDSSSAINNAGWEDAFHVLWSTYGRSQLPPALGPQWPADR